MALCRRRRSHRRSLQLRWRAFLWRGAFVRRPRPRHATQHHPRGQRGPCRSPSGLPPARHGRRDADGRPHGPRRGRRRPDQAAPAHVRARAASRPSRARAPPTGSRPPTACRSLGHALRPSDPPRPASATCPGGFGLPRPVGHDVGQRPRHAPDARFRRHRTRRRSQGSGLPTRRTRARHATRAGRAADSGLSCRATRPRGSGSSTAPAPSGPGAHPTPSELRPVTCSPCPYGGGSDRLRDIRPRARPAACPPGTRALARTTRAPSSGGGLPSPPGHPSPSAAAVCPRLRDTRAPARTHPAPSGSGRLGAHYAAHVPTTRLRPAPPLDDPSSTRPHDTHAQRVHGHQAPRHPRRMKPYDADTRPHEAVPSRRERNEAARHRPEASRQRRESRTTPTPSPTTATPGPTTASRTTRRAAVPRTSSPTTPSRTTTPGRPRHRPQARPPTTPPPRPRRQRRRQHPAAAAPARTSRATSTRPPWRRRARATSTSSSRCCPTQADRDRYVELSQKLSTDLSPAEAQHVADVRNQIKVDSGDIVTKALNRVRSAPTCRPAARARAASRRPGRTRWVARSPAARTWSTSTAARAQDGLALDERARAGRRSGGRAERDAAREQRSPPTRTSARTTCRSAGRRRTRRRHLGQGRTANQYQSPQEKAHYESSQQQWRRQVRGEAVRRLRPVHRYRVDDGRDAGVARRRRHTVA